MSNARDRRAPGTARIPFDAMVDVGGALGPSFEAQAVNLSEEGMSLRTAYLPEVGQPVTCRFDTGRGAIVVAAGEVLWKDDMGNGGEFGIRFTNLDGTSLNALHRVLGMSVDGEMPEAMPHGHKVRLHIEGLASPMRARIKDQFDVGVTAYSELGFLQMGRPLELEDAASGARRLAMIDRVQIEVDSSSRVPQLVVSLRYETQDSHASLAPVELPIDETYGKTPHDPTVAPEMRAVREEVVDEPMATSTARPDDEPTNEANDFDEPTSESSSQVGTKAAREQLDDESSDLANGVKNAFARSASKVTPALIAWAKRAKVATALLAARARRGSSTGDDVEIPVRRTTAPAPGGGLHASGRKVVRGSVPDARADEGLATKSTGLRKLGPIDVSPKRLAIGGAIGIAAIAGYVALRSPADAPVETTAPVDLSEVTPAPTALPEAPSLPAPTAHPFATAPMATANDRSAQAARPVGRPTPFTNGPVGSRPNVLRVKMDGPIESIQGATQPTGFTVVTPNRLVADPTISLTSKDSRLEGVDIENEINGAEFNVSFKDGVPNYIVRARGDVLEIVLARASGHDKAEANAKKKATKTTTKKR